MTKILIIEDNLETQFLLKRVLEPIYDIQIVEDLKSAWSAIEGDVWDIVILDRSLPDGDGLDLCFKIKKLNLTTPFSILMLTAHGQLDEKVEGLTAGADDYVVKPFEPRELLARIEALLRRRNESSQVNSVIKFENLMINIETHSVSVKKSSGEVIPLDLTPIEFKILLILVKNYNQEISRDNLIQAVWDKTNMSVRNIDTHVCHLRKKIAESNLAIKNRRNKGYYLKKNELLIKKPTSAITTLPHLKRSQHGNVAN